MKLGVGPSERDVETLDAYAVRAGLRSRSAALQVRLQPEATGLDPDSAAQAEQIRSVDTNRIGPVLGHVPIAVMAELDDAMRLHPALTPHRRDRMGGRFARGPRCLRVVVRQHVEEVVICRTRHDRSPPRPHRRRSSRGVAGPATGHRER